jgi:hypothetical protein
LSTKLRRPLRQRPSRRSWTRSPSTCPGSGVRGGTFIHITIERLSTDEERFGELASANRSAQYEFMVAELHIGPDGKGEGKLVPMAKVIYN